MNDADPIELVLSKLDGVRREHDGGFVAKCPAHDDHRPSLRVAKGDDGKCLVHCRAGCDAKAVVAALGLEMRDLHTPRSHAVTPRTRPTNPQAERAADGFETANDAAKAYAARLGRWSHSWTYRDAAGKPIGIVLRWSHPDGSKRDVRPIWFSAGKWRQQSLSGERPLFRLDALTNASRVYVTEGEKCAELLASLGFAATTSSGGSAAAHKSNWTALSGREVCILPDEDGAGLKYASEVRELCEALTPPARVRIVRLADLRPDSGDDIEQWLAMRQEPRVAASELQALTDAAFASDALDEPPEGSVSLADVVSDAAFMEPPEVIPSGMVNFDRALPFGACEVGTISVWGGEPGAGKSRWMVNLAASFARQGVRVAYLFGEMTPKRHSTRLLLAQADLGNDALRSDHPEHKQKLADAQQVLQTYGECIRWFAPPLTLEKLNAAAKWADVVMLDPLQAVRIAGHRHRHEELEALMQHCVGLCASHGIVFQMNSTIAKADDGRTRGLHDAFKGGSEIEQYMDAGWFIEATNDHGAQTVRCLKQRDGAKQPFTLYVGHGGWRVATVPPTEGGGQWI